MLFNKIKEGDIKTFEAVFRSYHQPLCLYAYSIVGQKDIADEIVQELFYVLWRDRGQINILTSVKSYLYRAVRNESLQYCEHCGVRARYREKVLGNVSEVDAINPQQQLEYKELEDVINQILEKLPDRRSTIFRMHRFEGLKYKEIADQLSVSVKTIEAEMTKTYQALRYGIEKYTRHTI